MFLVLLCFVSLVCARSTSNNTAAASERVEKILDLPVTLNFDDQPQNGIYGGYLKNEDEEKPPDGQFGQRIILGIVEDVPEVTTTKNDDQTKSQTIVKFFDKEDYDGIKINPIVVANIDDEAVRNRKEITERPPDEEHDENEDQKEEASPQPIREDTEEETEEEATEAPLRHIYEKTESEEVNQEPPKRIVEEVHQEPPKRIVEEVDTKHKKYEEYEIPYNQEVETPEQTEEKENITEDPPKNEETEEKETADATSKIEQSSEDQEEDKAPIQEIHEATSKIEQSSEDKEEDKAPIKETHEAAKKKNSKHSEGKGKENHSEKHGSKGEKGEKGYEGHHKQHKSKKGHHDKEKHGNDYTDEGGLKKKHHEEHGHHGEHLKGEKGEKGSKFSEEGKHNKGHSTKGEHNIHKKDEYEKKQEFYDEHHEGGEHEKHGGYHYDKHYEKGGHEKGGHHHGGKHEDQYGKKSEEEKGHHYNEKKGVKKATGHDQHHNHVTKHGKKAHKSGKKHWGYKKENGPGHEQEAHGNLRHVKKIPPPVIYPPYITRVRITENRRNDIVEAPSEQSPKVNKTNAIHTPTQKKSKKPKIYVIIPESYDKVTDEDVASIENASSYEDSTETKRGIPLEPESAESFPEEHRRRLSEIEYLVRRIGEEQNKKNRKPRQFTLYNNSEEQL